MWWLRFEHCYFHWKWHVYVPNNSIATRVMIFWLNISTWLVDLLFGDWANYFNIFFYVNVHIDFQKSMMGSPTFRFLSTVQGKSKSFAVMNLKILLTLMLYVALEKNKVAFNAFAYVLACFHCSNVSTYKSKSYLHDIKIY